LAALWIRASGSRRKAVDVRSKAAGTAALQSEVVPPARHAGRVHGGMRSGCPQAIPQRRADIPVRRFFHVTGTRNGHPSCPPGPNTFRRIVKTYKMHKLDPDAIAAFVLAQFDRCGLNNLECAAWRRFGFARREAGGRPWMYRRTLPRASVPRPFQSGGNRRTPKRGRASGARSPPAKFRSASGTPPGSCAAGGEVGDAPRSSTRSSSPASVTVSTPPPTCATSSAASAR